MSKTLLRKLGYGPSDRVCMIHADDLGMSGFELAAFEDILDAGLTVSGSAMPPCSGFAEVAAWRQRHPEVDLGVHLTLTSEWESPRWGPLSAPPWMDGLVDTTGFFHPRTDTVVRQVSAFAVNAEMNAQITHALDLGLKPTHLDCHMYTPLRPKFLEGYLALAQKYRLPVLLPRFYQHDEGAHGQCVAGWEAREYPVFDTIRTIPYRGSTDNHLDKIKNLLKELPVGLSCLLCHPVRDEGLHDNLTRDWPYRRADHRVFSGVELRTYLRRSDIQLVTYLSLLKT